MIYAEKLKLKQCSQVLMFMQSWTKSWYKLIDCVQALPSMAGHGAAMIGADVKDDQLSAGTLIQ